MAMHVPTHVPGERRGPGGGDEEGSLPPPGPSEMAHKHLGRRPCSLPDPHHGDVPRIMEMSFPPIMEITPTETGVHYPVMP